MTEYVYGIKKSGLSVIKLLKLQKKTFHCWDDDESIRKSLKKCNKTLISIYVNPTQFNNKKDFSTYSQSIMDLGAIICKRKNPLCDKCPVSQDCLARINNSTHLIPFKKKKLKKPLKKVIWLLPYTLKGRVYLRKRKNKNISIAITISEIFTPEIPLLQTSKNKSLKFSSTFI